MALPNPGMNFTPGTILPASDMNDIVENIESLADGSGIDNGAITGSKIAPATVTSNNIDFATFGGIVESINTATTSCTVFSSGLCIQTIKQTITGTISTSWFGMYILGALGPTNWPKAFTQLLALNKWSNPSGPQNYWVMMDEPASLTSSGGTYLISPENVATSRTYEVYTIGIGFVDLS